MTMRMTTMLMAATVAFAAPAMAQAVTKTEYVMKAGAGDLYEKTSSQMVLKTTHNPQVKKFANMMVMDHTKSTSMVKSAAMKSGIKPKPPMLDPMQKDMVAKLMAAKGMDRDAVYIDQQKTAHQMALSLHQDYSMSGDSAPLKMAAANIVPVVQHHIEMLDAMK